MKNIYKSILFPIAFAAISLFAGCSLNYEPLNKDNVNFYKNNSYINKCFVNSLNFRDEFSVGVESFYGTYNGYSVLLIQYGNALAEFDPSYYRKVYVGGVFLGNHHYIYDFYTFNESETDMAKTFMYLEDAYAEGIITKSNLKQIAYYIRNEK